MKKEQIDTLSALLKSISHPIRLQILCLLKAEELTVGQIQARLKTTNANISQHLTIMRHQDIIGFRKDANFIYNKITDNRIIELIDILQNLFCTTD